MVKDQSRNGTWKYVATIMGTIVITGFTGMVTLGFDRVSKDDLKEVKTKVDLIDTSNFFKMDDMKTMVNLMRSDIRSNTEAMIHLKESIDELKKG